MLKALNDEFVAKWLFPSRSGKTMPAKRIVNWVSVGADQVICPCGKVMELEPEDPGLVEGGN
jgi:hypothetical protein